MNLIRRHVRWEKLSPTTFGDLAQTLSEGPEWEYTSLVDRLLYPSRSTMVIRHRGNLILWDRGGFVFPRFVSNEAPPLRRMPYIRSIMGREQDVNRFCRLTGTQPQTIVPYHLMMRSPAHVTVPVIRGIECFPLSAAHHQAILPLELAYQREEVLLPGQLLHNASISQHLEWVLQRHIGVGVRTGGRIVAKAHTNARGVSCSQIGGVFTTPDQRGKGYAELAMRALLRTLQADQLHTSLFVKPHNTPGLRLYNRLGFVKTGRYTIAYA
ncbi:MAG: GNAT family N-acetyltransferase [Spirochaeta sp.]